VILTGQVGVAGHLEIGDGVIVTAQGGVGQDIEPGKVVSGSPSMDNKLWLRSTALIKRSRNYSNVSKPSRRNRTSRRRVIALLPGQAIAHFPCFDSCFDLLFFYTS
jgi:hypothetical protein